MRRVMLISELHPDPDICSWIVESSLSSSESDPLVILLQREQEELEDDMLVLLREYVNRK